MTRLAAWLLPDWALRIDRLSTVDYWDTLNGSPIREQHQAA